MSESIVSRDEVCCRRVRVGRLSGPVSCLLVAVVSLFVCCGNGSLSTPNPPQPLSPPYIVVLARATLNIRDHTIVAHL